MAKTNEELREEITNIQLATRGWSAASSEYREAYRQISELEEQVAAITAPRDQDGELSRWGAVAAAHLSGDRERARKLTERFMAEPISMATYHGLAYLVGDALFPPPALSAPAWSEHLTTSSQRRAEREAATSEEREAALDELCQMTQDAGGYE